MTYWLRSEKTVTRRPQVKKVCHSPARTNDLISVLHKDSAKTLLSTVVYYLPGPSESCVTRLSAMK